MSLNGEIMGSRRGGPGTLARRYHIDATGQSDPEEYVAAWLDANAPETLSGMPRSSFTIEEFDELEDHYEGTVEYAPTGTPATVPETDSVDYRFSFQAQGGMFYRSLATMLYASSGGSASDPSTLTPKPRNFKGALNVVHDSGKDTVQGFQIDPPPETFTLSYFPANATVTSAYQAQLSELCGKVNSYEFRGYPAGSLMLVRCSGGIRTGEDWSIDFGFAYVPNQTSIAVGDDITVSAKDGMDFLWAYYGPVNDDDANAVVPQPQSAYVERVWYREDFDLLALPS